MPDVVSSLQSAIVEWAQPRALLAVEAHQAAERTRWADSQDADEDGRRDTREFAETRAALRMLHNSQMGESKRHGRYEADLSASRSHRALGKYLPGEHGITMTVDNDGQKWWAWRRTITG